MSVPPECFFGRKDTLSKRVFLLFLIRGEEPNRIKVTDPQSGVIRSVFELIDLEMRLLL